MTSFNYKENGSFIRQDPISKEWVIFSPSRGNRPHDFAPMPAQNEMVHYDENCPFCPGNEDMLHFINLELRDKTNQTWNCRSIPNKYTALSNNTQPQRQRDDIYLCMGGYDHHEVVIDNPDHSKDIPQYTNLEYLQVIEMYYRRYRN